MGVPGITGCQNKALTTPLLFDPGERWDYGINIDWAGKMVEAASGQKLGQYLRDNVLGPARHGQHGLLHLAGACASGWPASTIAARTARSHPTWRSRSRRSRSSRWAAAGSTARPATTLKFVRMMLNQGSSDRGEQVLKPETVAQMSKNAMGDCKVGLLGRRSRRSPTTRSSSRAWRSSGAFPS